MENNSDELLELNEQGKVLYSLDKYEEAMKCFLKAEALDPYYQPTYENMGVCYVMMDRYDLARETFNKLLVINKKCGLAYFHLGNIALLENKAAEAKAHYSKAELYGFDDPVMFTNLVVFYEEAGDYENAAAQYAREMRKNPYDLATMGKKAQMQLRAAKFEDALKTAKTMVSTDVNLFDGHHYLYVSLIMLHRLEEAETYIEDMIKRFPDNQSVLFDRIRFYDMTGDGARALKLLNEDFPDAEKYYHVALLKMGLLLQQQKVDEAMDLVEASPALKSDADALTMMYSVYFSRGNYKMALDYCEMIAELGANSSQYYATWYFSPLAKMRMGRTEEANNDFRKASSELKAICLKNPAQVDLYMYRALCEFQLGNLKEAKKIVEYLLAVKNDAAVFHLAASIIYAAAGDSVLAEKHKATAAELDPNMVAPMI